MHGHLKKLSEVGIYMDEEAVKTVQTFSTPLPASVPTGTGSNNTKHLSVYDRANTVATGTELERRS